MKKIIYLSILAFLLCLTHNLAEAQTSKGKAKKRATTTVAKADAVKPEATAQPAESPAAEAAKPESKPDGEKKSDDGESGNISGAFDIGGIGGSGDLPFDKMKAAMVEFNPDGMTVLTSNQITKVHIESKDFNITCDLLKMDNKTKMVYATGAPVKLERGSTIQGFCRNLVYDVDKRRATLENEASIIQDKGKGQKVKVTADKIFIDNSENKDGKGQPKITLSMREGSNNVPQIEALGKKEGDSEKKPSKTQKVSSNNMDLIKVPGVD